MPSPNSFLTLFYFYSTLFFFPKRLGYLHPEKIKHILQELIPPDHAGHKRTMFCDFKLIFRMVPLGKLCIQRVRWSSDLTKVERERLIILMLVKVDTCEKHFCCFRQFKCSPGQCEGDDHLASWWQRNRDTTVMHFTPSLRFPSNTFKTCHRVPRDGTVWQSDLISQQVATPLIHPWIYAFFSVIL